MSDVTFLHSARAIFTQTKKNTVGIRGSIWAGALLVLLIVVVPVELIFTVLLFHGVMHVPLTLLQGGGVWFSMVIVSRLLNLLMGVFAAAPIWVGLSHVRGQSVGAWTAFKYVASRYGRLFCFSLLLCVLSGVLSSLSALITASLHTVSAWSWVDPTVTAIFDLALCLFMMSLVYVMPLLLETKDSVMKAMRSSWHCVREHKQAWLLIRTALLLLLWVATIGVIILFPMYLNTMIHHAQWFFEAVSLLLVVLAVIWGMPFLMMLPNTLYSHFFDTEGEVLSVVMGDVSEE